ncbi:Leptomycin B resistance protein pmd1-like protein 3 [Colletotrichum chlorophyti]|uniref:Leptomycin B resistance protein pmd1-like protein 3 n=1 Tax=Colletotrichum chlorophyti TaxID=708187 RepID=A0A1Q8S462_9PEZI|nr:Leptomycin B resistance protein pmd1-like protein 3 [Colletotrichum chlorophyti]
MAVVEKQEPEQMAPPAAEEPKKDEEEVKEVPKGLPLYKQIFVYFRLLFAADPTWLDYFLVLFGTITAIAAGVPFPLMGIIFGQLVDNMNGATCAAEDNLDAFAYESAINQKVIQTAYVGAIALVLIYSYILSWSIISQRLAQRMRTKYVSALLRQPPSYFDKRAAAGEVSSRLHGDITAIQAGTSEKVGVVIASLSFFVTVFIIAFMKQPKLAGMLVSMLPAFMLSSFVGGSYITKHAGRMTEAIASASSIASEALSHMSVVQAFGAGPRLEAKFADHMITARSAGVRKAAAAAVQAGLLYFIAYAGNALAFWQGSIRIADSMAGRGDGATVGEIYAVVYLLVDACVMLGSIAPILPLLGGASAAYTRLWEDIVAPSEIDGTSDQGKVLPLDDPKGIALRNVTFEYPSRPGQPVLRDVSVDFPAGKYTAVVGLSGSGKSTIAALVARLQDPNQGEILLNGHDLRQLNVRSLRSFISFVQQEPSLLDCSILENIALGLVNSPKESHQHLKPFLAGHQLAEIASRGKEALSSANNYGPEIQEIVNLVRQAAEQADAASFINRLDDGYGTSAGPSGTLVSGGQRQRIALARALIRDPKILVLDEATSALDSASEKRIQRAVEQAATENRTIISIAHRLSTIRNADNIVVMEAGQVVEQGTYTELMAREDGAFARMARLQTVGTAERMPDAGSVSGDSLDASTLKGDHVINEKAEDPDAQVESKELKHAKSSDDEEKKKEPEIAGLDESKPYSTVFKGLVRLIRPSLAWLVVAVIAATIVGATFSGSGLIFGYTVGALNPCASTYERVLSMGRFFAGLLFGLACIEFFANFAAWSCFGVISEKLLYSVRVLSFRSLLEQDVQWHQSDGRTASGLLTIITKDSAAIGGFSGSTIGTVFAICVNVLVAVILSHIIAWKIALVCLVTIPILLGSGFMQLRMLARYEERHSAAFTTATSVATEAVQSIKTVAALSLESQVMENYSRLLVPPQKQMVRASASTNIWLAISNVTGTFVNALAYWWGTQLIMKGEYTQTQFLIILVAMLISAQLWGSMFSLAPEFSRARTALSRIMSVINLGKNDDLSKTGTQPKQIFGDSQAGEDVEATGEVKAKRPNSGGVRVTFKNVTFCYPSRPDINILDNISFTLQPGQFCGLVGPSGAGKSTIMNLVQRLYFPTSGSVLIDGHDISNLPTSFRDTIAIVPQDPTLFDGSVRFNVGLGSSPDTEATHAEIEEACKLANIHDVIMALPEGYDTECGPSASRLSGGQRQRLAIARALVRKPRLLLLDESTSALDAASEAALQEGLERASRGTTVLAITHRLHTVQKANVIFLVEGGQIADSGTHQELMERRESYRINAMQQMLQ